MNLSRHQILQAKLSVAPMIDWTYSHFRVLMRMLAPEVLLYTEMQTIGAIKNNPKRALDYESIEHPIALQVGGSRTDDMIFAANEANAAGYVEINLNLGCPSSKVQAGQFGACLMKEGAQVADMIQAMKQASPLIVSAKTRIGVDDNDSYAFFSDFAHRLVEAGCDKVIIHARKAWLSGLNPKQNRTIPPINYEYVYRLKQELPEIPVIINGDIQHMDAINQHLKKVEGVMLGRLVCNNPYALATIHQALYPDIPILSRIEVLAQYLAFAGREHEKGVPIGVLIKPIINLGHGLLGAKAWKAQITQGLVQRDWSQILASQSLFREIALSE